MGWSEEVRARLDQASRGRAELRFCLPVQASDLQAALGEIERLRQQWDTGVRAGMTATAEQQGRILELQAEVERLRMWEEAGKEYLADRDEMRKTLERTVVDSMRLGALLERAELVIPPGPLSREIRAALGEEGRS